MGGKIEIPNIELPFEAQVVIRKCMNGALILTRKGEVFEMRFDKIYKINEDYEVFATDIRSSASLPNQEREK